MILTSIFSNFLLCYLSSDFFSGVIHWWEDRYIKSNDPVFGKHIGAPNEKHHNEPAHFLKGSYFKRIKVSLVASAIVGATLWIAGVRAWQIYCVLLILSQANQIHAWAHQSFRKNGPVISFFQKTGLLQSTKHHAMHHKHPNNCNYCVITNLLNPILEKIRFWNVLEMLVEKVFGHKPLKNQ